MRSVPINRTRALVICNAPQPYAPSRVHEAAAYLLQSLASTEEEQRLATEAMEWLIPPTQPGYAVRAWDLASSVTGDWTVGLKLEVLKNHSAGWMIS